MRYDCSRGKGGRMLMETIWQTFMDGLNSFTDDIFEDGRDQGE